MPKTMLLKRIKKADREMRILDGLIELYIQTGRPIGSQTLQENGCEDLSSATIRNYCAKLEENGYLLQQHASGGRIPTDQAFRFYANEAIAANELDSKSKNLLDKLQIVETQEPASYLGQACDLLSELSGLAVFISAPRFDHDFIRDIKLVPLDAKRLLSVILTNFGLIQTEILPSDQRLNLKKLENYFIWRLHGKEGPIIALETEEEELADHLYHEIMVRYLVNQGSYTQADLHRSGFFRLLRYPEFNEAAVIAGTLSLFENKEGLGKLLKEIMSAPKPFFAIGDEAKVYTEHAKGASIIGLPYYLNQTAAGAIGIIGPCRMPYKRLFALLKATSGLVSDCLTRSLYKFKLHYRQPLGASNVYLEQRDRLLLDFNSIGKP